MAIFKNKTIIKIEEKKDREQDVVRKVCVGGWVGVGVSHDFLPS